MGTAFKTLDEEIKMTSRRVNALEYVLIPRIEVVVAYIIQEIDEQAREEFFRVKKVVQKKKQKHAAELLENEKEEAVLEAKNVEKTSRTAPAPSAAPVATAAVPAMEAKKVEETGKTAPAPSAAPVAT